MIQRAGTDQMEDKEPDDSEQVSSTDALARSLQNWVECDQMAPGGLSLQAHRHVKCLHIASVWASV